MQMMGITTMIGMAPDTTMGTTITITQPIILGAETIIGVGPTITDTITVIGMDIMEGVDTMVEVTEAGTIKKFSCNNYLFLT